LLQCERNVFPRKLNPFQIIEDIASEWHCFTVQISGQGEVRSILNRSIFRKKNPERSRMFVNILSCSTVGTLSVVLASS